MSFSLYWIGKQAALFGRNLNITYQDVTVKHRVNEKNGEYRFELDLGGVLDVE